MSDGEVMKIVTGAVQEFGLVSEVHARGAAMNVLMALDISGWSVERKWMAHDMEQLESLVSQMLSPIPCRDSPRGGCLSHGEGRSCIHGEARKLLGRLRLQREFAERAAAGVPDEETPNGR